MSSTSATRFPPAARILPSNVFYGWYIALACGLLMFVGVGVGYYGLAVFLKPLKDEHGWSTTLVSGATGLYFTVSGLTSGFVGPRIDRSGPMKFMIAGAILNGFSAAAIGFVEEAWQLYAVYTVLAVAFGMSSAVAVNAIMTRWFVRRRARAMSISSTGVSLGGVILSPLISKMIDIGGIELAAPVMGALVASVSLPVILLVVAWDPADMGLKPDGNLPPAPESAASLHAESVQMRRWTNAEARRSMAFWSILIAFLLVLSAQTGYVFHQISFLEDRLGSRSMAAFALSATAGGSIIARLIVGMFADAVDKRLLTFVLFVVQATAILAIIHTGNVAATWAITLVFGFTIGNVYMMQSLLVGEIFGLVSFGAIFGMVNLVGQVGAGAGPFGVGFLHDQTGGYSVPFTVTAGLTYLAAFVILFARPPVPATLTPTER
ncbi:MAG: MFS transporter [Dehalococcoidia bacterium]|nr:MFS transporter [Dehalococcoidia bacterium]